MGHKKDRSSNEKQSKVINRNTMLEIGEKKKSSDILVRTRKRTSFKNVTKTFKETQQIISKKSELNKTTFEESVVANVNKEKIIQNINNTN